MISNRQYLGGFSLIEVLVTIVIMVIGLLGMAGLQANALTAQMESYQRSQALIILKDITDRINANSPNAANYVTDDESARGTGFNDSEVLDCTGSTGSALDLCEWHNSLLGSSEKTSGNNVGAMIGARGCIYNTATNQYLVAIAWQGLSPTATSPIDCGAGEYGTNDAFRRVIALPLTIPDLD